MELDENLLKEKSTRIKEAMALDLEPTEKSLLIALLTNPQNHP
jgi:hypothetical protein